MKKTKNASLQSEPKTAPLPRASANPERSSNKRASPDLQEILVPLDFSEPSQDALRYAADFAHKFGVRLTLLYVLEPIPYPNDFGATFPLVEEEKDIMAEAKRKLATFAVNEGAEGSKIVVRTGKAFTEICAAAKELKTDLIIIATHGYTGLKHALLGSTAERVVRHAPCPVLVVRQHERG